MVCVQPCMRVRECMHARLVHATPRYVPNYLEVVAKITI